MCSVPGDDDGPRTVAAVREEEQTLRAGGAALREFVAQPATGFRRGAVLIINDVWGYTDFDKDLARRITGHGHAAALVDFFGRQGDLPESMRAPERTGSKPEAVARAMQRAQQLSDERLLADVQTAVDDLRARGGPTGLPVGDSAWAAGSPTSRPPGCGGWPVPSPITDFSRRSQAGCRRCSSRAKSVFRFSASSTVPTRGFPPTRSRHFLIRSTLTKNS